MARFTIGTIPIEISSTIIAKCYVALSAWETQGKLRDREEFNAYCHALVKAAMHRNTESLNLFCIGVIGDIGKIRRRYNVTLRPAREFGSRLSRVLKDREYRQRVIQQAEHYERWLTQFMGSAYAELAARAVGYFIDWGVVPSQLTFTAVDSFGTMIAGKHVPWLKATAVQMNVACNEPYAALCFIETLLHEQVHAVVYYHLGEDDSRRELEWLHELGAILTSQHAMGRAAADLRSTAIRQEVREYLQWSRRVFAYGDLARQVLIDTHDPALGWHIWQQIISARRISKQDYACRHHLELFLQEAGWLVELPYRYGEKEVNAIDCHEERWIR